LEVECQDGGEYSFAVTLARLLKEKSEGEFVEEKMCHARRAKRIELSKKKRAEQGAPEQKSEGKFVKEKMCNARRTGADG